MSAALPITTWPRMGPWVPGFAVRVVTAVIAATLCVALLPAGSWTVIGLVLTAVSVAQPRLLAAWGLIIVLGGSVFARQPAADDWHFFVLLAGMHLLHLLSAQVLVIPWNGRVQLLVFRPLLRRFLLIQVPSQLVAFGVLLLFAPHGLVTANLPAVGAVGAIAVVALLALVAVLIWPAVRRPPT